MGSKSVSSIALMLSLNLLFFSLVSCNTLTPATPAPPKCPNLQVCADIFLHPFLPHHNCCPLISGLVDLDAAVCLCDVLKLNLGGISLNLDILVNILLNTCERTPTTYHCK
ncbi:hypothetical protein PHAVU_006G138900 [Phaseolus vulgaris]|uniref:Hydrophobic seed protein domain-containing protein n=1 Tax=Phaseolus vulgaris TaxID=3885 RepID=V7BNM3_PHAVU|nr:hypothetical protein PHAVU_006G138900g [Phaseolus vulgaris]ESW19599.1 hypothetical protein PHAVU_006G138900g [Phaseolus vulgaris]